MSETWHTTVGELLTIFRESLLALLPTMARAHIAWREGQAYDDWDEITQALYRNIVGRSLVHASEHEDDLDTMLPRYNTIQHSYGNRNILLVSDGDRTGAFVGLSTGGQPFDTVDYVLLDSEGRPTGNGCVRVRLNDARLQFRRPDSPDRLVDELLVEL